MSSVLPTTITKATRVDPLISLFYGPPKIGKTTEMAKLPGNLILDFERGTELIDALKIPITSVSGGTSYAEDGTLLSTSVDEVYNQIVAGAVAKAKETGKKPKPPYKYITIDTIDKLEEMCEVTATAKYKQSTIGKTFDGKSVIELPQGSGYYHIRVELMLYIDKLCSICEYLIIISHLKDKVLNKGGIDVSVQDISLTGKLGQIVAARCDLIGYMYRSSGKPELMVSFETTENSTMGARIPRLAGKRLPFNWDVIFTEQGVNAVK